MRHNLQDLERQSTEVSQKLYKTEQQLEESKEETRNARLLAERFRGYIQKGATNANELIDSDIQSKLSSIQHQTTRIVNDYCVGSPSHPPRNDVLRFQNQKVNQTMHEYKNEDPEALHQFLMRHNIYKLLKVEIFDKPVFGLGDEIEVKLKKLEGLLLEENQNSREFLTYESENFNGNNRYRERHWRVASAYRKTCQVFVYETNEPTSKTSLSYTETI